MPFYKDQGLFLNFGEPLKGVSNNDMHTFLFLKDHFGCREEVLIDLQPFNKVATVAEVLV